MANFQLPNLHNKIAMAKENKQPRVILFTTPSCKYCRTAKGYLRQQGIKFKDVDVSRDQAAARDMVRRSGQQGVPQTDIEGTMIVGFDKGRINELLGISQ